MYTSRMSPMSRMRNRERSEAKKKFVQSHNPKRKAQTITGIPSSSAAAVAAVSSNASYHSSHHSHHQGASTIPPSPRMTGDYQVLKQNVEQHRFCVRQARSELASSLDRLGEHHIRQKEYDDAMDAFTEALHEKRSIFFGNSNNSSSSSWRCLGSASAMSSSGGFECDSSLTSSYFNTSSASTAQLEERDHAIDEIIQTLRNMGNVHSLRGEQDEAMRYYAEVTNLRASKTSTRTGEMGGEESLLSGFGEEDNSTLMSEINEDVKALDDMFRSISFRNQEISNSLTDSGKRVVKPLTASTDNTSPSSKRRKGDTVTGVLISHESEPFRRSTSLGFPATGNEMTEALETYKNVLESYKGPNLEIQKEIFNSLALRVDLLAEELTRGNTNESNTCDSTSKNTHGGGHAIDLELAVEIYQNVLSAQHEINASFSSTDPNDTTSSTTTATALTSANPQLAANIASTLIRMGSLYYKLGNRLEELRMYREAKDTYCRAFGEQHAFVAGARKNIGMVLAERGEYEAAMEQFEHAQRIYLEVHQGDARTRDVASAISCMGNVKNRVGELDAALERYMEALRIYKAVQEDAVDAEGTSMALRDVTATLKVIGMVHAKKGDLDLAMAYFSEAMSLLRSSGVDATPTGFETTASVLTRMASIHVKKGDLDQAMDHYREAYELTVRNRGTTNHQEVAGILHYIGGVFHKRAAYDEAMDCYQEAIRIYHSTLGPGNPTVAGTLVMVGSIHYKRRNLDSAMMFYREALRLNRDAYGMHHPDIAPILKSIGTILTKKGEYQEAYDVFRDVLSIKCTIHGTGHPEVASAYKSLGNVHYKLGELADAERQYRHALSIYRRSRGEDHPDTMAARTTIEHIRYWMKERGQRRLEETRQSRSTSKSRAEDDERSC